MIQKLIPYIILSQILVGLFHVWIGLEEWRHTGIYDTQTCFLLTLGVGSFLVYIRLRFMPVSKRSLQIIFEHAVFIWMITWLFYKPWWDNWEIFLVIFITINIILSLFFNIIKWQLGNIFSLKTFWFPDSLWKIWCLLTLINTITLPPILVLLNQNLSFVWIFFWVNWIFLWKQDLSVNFNQVIE